LNSEQFFKCAGDVRAERSRHRFVDCARALRARGTTVASRCHLGSGRVHMVVSLARGDLAFVSTLAMAARRQEYAFAMRVLVCGK
jgi:NAD/NADP transhydrogenase beta subunit